MITFVTDKDKNNSPLEDDAPEIGVTSKGQPVEKIIEDAEAANEAEKAEKTEETKEETPSAPSSEELIQNLIEREFSIKEHNTKFYKGNLRNGMSLDFDGSLVILGDVNPGAQVTATGNILILGALKGLAHAGCKGSSEAFVLAINHIPVQLRIGSIITRFPDGDSKVNRKPEYAYVEDGKIYVSAFE